jgi:hypothetical protein
VELTGSPDVLDEDGSNFDHKSSARTTGKSYVVQQGIYSILERSSGYPKPKRLIINDFRRVGPKTFQPELVQYEYDPYFAEKIGFSTLRNIKRDFRGYERTGDPNSFEARPSSMSCKKGLCNAHGTEWCPYGRPEKGG